MDLEPATKEVIKSISQLIRNVLEKVSTLERIFQLFILKENIKAIQKKNRASYLKMDNLKQKSRKKG